MFIGSLFLLLAAPGSPRLKDDTAFLTRIDRAVARMSDKKTAFVQFEKTVTRADAIRCNQVLPNLKPNSVFYADCAFVQAWYGIDYAKNIYRLQRPWRVWIGKTDKWLADYPEDTDGKKLTDLTGITGALNWLYLKHHDLKSLGAWEDMKLDGHWAEGNSDELADLWKRHAPDMLKAASVSPTRANNLAEEVAFGVGAYDLPERERALLAELKAYSLSKDKRIAATAKRIGRHIKFVIKRANDYRKR